MNRKISLALSGGGARGMAHVGVIHELEARGYEIVAISGTSIGSMVAGAYASGKLREFEQFMTALRIDDVVGYMDVSLRQDGLLSGNRVLAQMQKYVPDCRIEDLPIPLSIVATDLQTGCKRVFRSGSLYHAMRASIAIPILLSTVKDCGHIMVDGGLTDPIPFDEVARVKGSLLAGISLYGTADPRIDRRRQHRRQHFRRLGITDKLALRWRAMRDWKVSAYKSLLSREPATTGYIATARRASSVMLKRMTQMSIAMAKPDILFEVPDNCAGPLDFHQSRHLIALGQRIGRETLDKYEAEHPTLRRRIERMLKRGDGK